MAHKPEVKIYRDMVLGIGGYGKVVMAAYGELPCAAKILHSTFFRFHDPAEQNIIQKFRDECDLLSTIQHPNIVKYLGTVRNHKSQRPALLMELMHESLTKLLERSKCPLSNLSQLNIGFDVANALAYLHSKSIVHRDLSSNNILLTAEGTAKVTDFGMSKLIDMNTSATPLTLCPGTTVYMPPEAQITPPTYTNKLDCFSFGVLAIQTATRQFPNPSDGSKYVDDPRYSGGRVIVQIAEIERRKNHIDLIEPGHPLLPLIRECLKDRDTERPSAHKLCDQIFLLRESERIQVETEKDDSEVEKETNQCASSSTTTPVTSQQLPSPPENISGSKAQIGVSQLPPGQSNSANNKRRPPPPLPLKTDLERSTIERRSSPLPSNVNSPPLQIPTPTLPGQMTPNPEERALEERFDFNTALPLPDQWSRGPKTYPSQARERHLSTSVGGNDSYHPRPRPPPFQPPRSQPVTSARATSPTIRGIRFFPGSI